MSTTAPAAARLGDLEISAAFARATLPGAKTGGAYVTVTNHGAAPETLVGASSPVAGHVGLHAMSMDGQVMKMRELPEGIAIPAGKTVAMAPDGLHMMLEQLHQPLVEGKAIAVTLDFARAGSITVDVPVLGIAAKAAAHGMGM